MQKHLFCMQSRRSDICVRVRACECVSAFAVLPQDRTKLQRHPDYLSLMQISALEMKRVNPETGLVVASGCRWSLSKWGYLCSRSPPRALSLLRLFNAPFPPFIMY